MSDEGLDVDKLERCLSKEIERFRKQMLGKILQEIKAKKPEEARQEEPTREVYKHSQPSGGCGKPTVVILKKLPVQKGIVFLLTDAEL